MYVHTITLAVDGLFPYTVRMSERVLTARLELRLTEEEKELFQRAADRDGRPVSNWIRQRLVQLAQEELASGEKVKGRGKRSSPSP